MVWQLVQKVIPAVCLVLLTLTAIPVWRAVMALRKSLKQGRLRWPGPEIVGTQSEMRKRRGREPHYLFPIFMAYARSMWLIVVGCVFLLLVKFFGWFGDSAFFQRALPFPIISAVPVTLINIGYLLYWTSWVRSLIDQISPEEVNNLVDAIRNGRGCEQGRLGDLLFPLPTGWERRKRKTGHWEFMPSDMGPGFFVTARFFSTRGTDTPEDLMREAEGKASERGWTLKAKNRRPIAGKAEAIDVLAVAGNDVTHRFVNFCYSGIEYFFDIKSNSSQAMEHVSPILDAWIDAFIL